MFFYEGQSCPVCGQLFTESDDIVSCPVCGAPHHRACWSAEGRCHFESAHGTAEQWTRPEPQDAPRNRCPNCGMDNPENAEFCSRCGRALNPQEWPDPSGRQSPPQYGQSAPCNEYAPFHITFDPLGGVPRGEIFEGGVTAEELAVCVGNNTTYYIPRFQRMKNGRTVQWNWAAFLITPYWLFYRKQYTAGVLVSLACVLINLMMNLVFYLSGAGDTISYAEAFEQTYQAGNFPSLFLLAIASVVICLLFGLFGNRLYMNACLKKTRQMKEQNPGEFRPALKRAGGVSFVWAMLAYFGIGFLSSFLCVLLL